MTRIERCVVKRFSLLLLLICLLTVSTACENSTSESTQASTGTNYNVEVFDGKYVTITCVEIRNDGVVFSVLSKLDNNPISVVINDVSLDGQTPAILGSGSNWVDVEPGKTATAIYESEIPNTDHKNMSILGTVFNNQGSGVEDIEVANLDIGGTEHIDFNEPNGDTMFKNTEFQIDYVGATDRGLVFRCHNYEDYRIQASISKQVEINNEAIDLQAVSICNVAPNSAKDYVINIIDSYPDFSPDKIKQFKIIAAYRSAYYEQDPFTMEK